MRHLYGRMRSTIEKIVEDIYCAGIVTRFEDMVGVGNLHRISGIDRASCDEMSELWKKCHRIIEAHDQSANKQTQLPTPDEFRADLERIADLAQKVAGNQPKK